MERLLGRALPLAEVAERAAARFAEVFELKYTPDRWVPAA
jgi:hypothetical protein